MSSSSSRLQRSAVSFRRHGSSGRIWDAPLRSFDLKGPSTTSTAAAAVALLVEGSLAPDPSPQAARFIVRHGSGGIPESPATWLPQGVRPPPPGADHARTPVRGASGGVDGSRRRCAHALAMASSKFPALLLLLVAVLAVAVPRVPMTSAAAEYCRDSLDGLTACHGFMYEGAPAASADCCAAYRVAFDANPFCLCYIANGVYGRSTGYDVNVTHALEIPTSCGQTAPPIELCGMQGLVLPPYSPDQSPEASSSPAPAAAQPSPAAAGPVPEPPQSSPAPPSFTSPPPPPPTSSGDRDSEVQMATVFVCAIAAYVAFSS